MFIYVCAVLFLTGNAFGNKRANDFLESLLNSSFVEEVNNLTLDPVPLSNFTIEFEDMMNVTGKAYFKKGNLSGLSSAKRISECQGSFDIEPKALNCTISWEKLKVVYKGKMRYGKISSGKIKGKAKLNSSTVYLEIAEDSTKAVLKEYTCNLGRMEVKFTGQNDWLPLNRFLNIMTEGYKSNVMARIYETMTHRLRSAFENALTKVLFPTLADSRGGDWGLEPPPEL